MGLGGVVKNLTPGSPERAIVREQMPLHASQNRISWSYEPVTSITGISLGRTEAGLEPVGAGMVQMLKGVQRSTGHGGTRDLNRHLNSDRKKNKKIKRLL